MSDIEQQPETDGDLAARLAYEAGELLLALRAQGEFSGRALGDEGDRRANALLMAALRDARPDDGILSEETRDTPERLGKRRIWIVDPVDGTREYGEGRPDWAVHVGLAVDGVATLGAVPLPGMAGQGVLRSDEPLLRDATTGRPRMVVSRSRPPVEAEKAAAAVDAEIVPMGSAGAKAMAVVRGAAEIYLHSGGQHEWDSCAPVAVALGHGLHCSRLDGSPLRYNARDTYLPDLLICRPELARPILDAIA
ncbi:MAG: 3'(2'),5'-bisphosphate nucleotidase CysQ [Pseudomonadota bacterium]|nr:3'(2'),5'-bisphosphate nucleotidase CysQ [Pseudomonadota bacterium]